VLTVTYIGAGALAGVGGALLVTIQRYVSPAHIGFETSSLVLLAVVIGGGASLVGALVAAGLIVFTRDWLSGPWPGHGPLLLGVLFVVAVYTLPGGLSGLVAGGPRAAWRTLAPGTMGGASPTRAKPAHGVASEGGLLVLTGLTRRYGALAAVDGLDLRVRRGARHALLGPNGAGKSTVLAMVAGATEATSGTIAFAGRDITRLGPARRSRLGIARAFQQPAVVPSLSVLDNVCLAAWRHTDVRAPCRRAGYRRLAVEAAAHLETVGLRGQADTIAGELSHGARRLLDIAMALAGRPELLLLDEPAAGLTDVDIARLSAVLRALPHEVTVILVEHDFALVREVADTVTVLAAGAVVASGTPDEIAAHPHVRATYLGTTEPEPQEVG